MSGIVDDIHDKLTKAYIEYYKAVESFDKHGGERSMRHVRKCLRDIRSLAKLRGDEIKKIFDSKKGTKKS